MGLRFQLSGYTTTIDPATAIARVLAIIDPPPRLTDSESKNADALLIFADGCLLINHGQTGRRSDNELALESLESIDVSPADANLDTIAKRVDFLASIRRGLIEFEKSETVSLVDVQKQLARWLSKLFGRSRPGMFCGISSSISQRGTTLSLNLLLCLMAKVDVLARFPNIGRVVPVERDEEISEMIFPPFRIFYRFVEQDAIIAIVRVWHGARCGVT